MVLYMARPFKHPKTGVYWFRKVVPIALRSIVGKVEERRTLRTKDPRQAALRHAQMAAQVAQEWLALQNQPQPVPWRYARHSAPEDRYDEALAAAGYIDERDAPDDWLPPPEAGVTLPGDRHAPATLTTILTAWTAEARSIGRKPSTINGYTRIVGRLADVSQGRSPNDDLTPTSILQYKDHRLAGGSSPRTVVQEIAALKSIFSWAVANHLLPSNPAQGIRIKAPKPQKLRGKGLTEVEAQTILQASLKATGARRWVPWLAAYTGARVGELAQLRQQDVRKDGEYWTIHLTPEAGTMKTNEARTVVLHPHLIELGFPEFAQSAPAGPLFLPPSGDTLTQLRSLKNRLAEFVRRVVPDPNVAPMHGFRHRFKTVGMDAGVSTRVLDAIQGHAGRTAGDGYGDVTVKAMAMAMERIPRVEL
jgi:integrase